MKRPWKIMNIYDLNDGTMEILDAFYVHEEKIDDYLAGVEVINDLFEIGKHFGENIGEIVNWVRSGMPKMPKVNFVFNLQLFSAGDSVVKEEKIMTKYYEKDPVIKKLQLNAKQVKTIISFAKYIGCETMSFEGRLVTENEEFILNPQVRIKYIKINRIGCLIRLQCGLNYFASNDGEFKGVIPADHVRTYETKMASVGFRFINSEEKMRNAVFDYCEYLETKKDIWSKITSARRFASKFANKAKKEAIARLRKMCYPVYSKYKEVKLLKEEHKAMVTKKRFFEDRLHEFLTREDKGYYVTAIHFEGEYVFKKIKFDSNKKESEAISKFFHNSKNHIPNPSDVIAKKVEGRWALLRKTFVLSKVYREIQSCDYTRKAAKLQMVERMVAAGNMKDTVLRSVKRYTEAFIMIEVKGADELPYIISETQKDDAGNIKYIPRTIYKFGYGESESWLVENPENENEMYSLFTGKTYPKDEFAKYSDQCIRYNAPESGIAAVTAGQLKQFNLPSPASNIQNFDWKELLNEMTYGAYNMIFNGQVVGAKALAQAASRASLADAPSINLKSIGNFAVFMGKFSDNAGNEFMDGLAFWAAEHAAEIFNGNNRLKFKVDVLEGSASQMRPYNCKTLAAILRREAINEIMSHYGSEVVVLVRGKIDETQQQQFNMCFTEEKKKSNFWGKTVILCDDENNIDVNYYTDLNGLKMTFDLNRQSTCNVLSISSQHKSLKNGSTLSTQLLNSLNCVDPDKTGEIIQEHAEKMIERKAEALGLKKNAEGKWIHEILKPDENIDIEFVTGQSIYVNTIIEKLCPEIANTILFDSYKSSADKTIEGLVTAACQLKLPTEGVYCKAVVDYSMIISMNRVLGTTKEGYIECYAPAMKKAGIDKAIGVKFPKMGINEFAKFVSVSLEEIQERLEKLVDEEKITENVKDVISKVYKNTSPGVIVIPAVEILKKLLAGMDFDGDAIQLYFNDKIVEMLWNVDAIAVNINPKGMDDNSKSNQVANIINKDSAFNTFVNFVESNNANVGQVTVAHMLGVETIIRLKKFFAVENRGNCEEYQKKLENILGLIKDSWALVFSDTGFHFTVKRNAIPELAKTFDKIVDDDIVDNIIVHNIDKFKIEDFLGACSLISSGGLENLEKAAKIFMEIGRFYQELTIDAAKTAMQITIPYFDNTQRLHLACRQLTTDLFDVKINWNGTEDIEKLQELNEERLEKADCVDGLKRWQLRNIKWTLHKNCRSIWYKGEDDVARDNVAFKYILVDEIHRERIKVAEKIVELASAIPEQKQAISEEFKKFIDDKVKGYEKYFALIKTEKDKYMSISTAKNEQLGQLRQRLNGLNDEIIEARMKAVKKSYDPFFKAITNTVRKGTYGVTPVTRAAIAFKVMLDSAVDKNKLATFCRNILPEEYVLLMIEVQKVIYGYPVPKVTDKLLACTYTEGAVVNFKDGKDCYGGDKAIALSKLNGTFTIAQDENGDLVAETEIDKFLSARVPQVTENTLCYMTVANDECSVAADYAYKKLKVGAEATVVAYRYINGKQQDLSSSIIVDGEEITHYAANPLNDREGAKVLSRLYGSKRGKVGFSLKYEKNFGRKKYNVILFTLEDVKAANVAGMEVKPLKVDLSQNNQENKYPNSRAKIEEFKKRVGLTSSPVSQEKVQPKPVKKPQIDRCADAKAKSEALHKKLGIPSTPVVKKEVQVKPVEKKPEIDFDAFYKEFNIKDINFDELYEEFGIEDIEV